MRYKGTNMEMTINNHTISYTDEGPSNAPVIILIHGFPFNKSMWNKQVDLLLENCRVIAYDIRGFGNSNAGTVDFSIELFVDDLIDLMDTLKIETAMLCGLSMGGYIALNAIEKFPKRFYALILCDTNCVADTPEVADKRMKTIESIQEKGLEQYAIASVKTLFAPESFVTNKEKIEMIKEMIKEASLPSLSKTLFALARRKETCTNLHRINIPVLVLVGKEDQVTPPDAARMMQKSIKGSILKIIEHAGHLSNIENSYEFNIQLEKFVAAVNNHSIKRGQGIHKS